MENFQIIEHYNEQRKNEMISFLESKCELPNQLKGNLHVFSLPLLTLMILITLVIFPLCLQMMTFKTPQVKGERVI